MPDADDRELPFPAWSLRAGDAPAVPLTWDGPGGREWAWGGSTGRGVRVAIVDSGVDTTHPRVGAIAASVAAVTQPDGSIAVLPDDTGDLTGHGTACAGVVRELAPDADLVSVRVLDDDFTGGGDALIAGIAWAVKEGVDVVNLSLSTTSERHVAVLRRLADLAAFRGTLLVASAHNRSRESYPWRFSNVVSVGSHEDVGDRERLLLNPAPPVDLYACGVEVPVAWLGGTVERLTGNSFATPHVTALAARILARRPGLPPHAVRTALTLAADNVVLTSEPPA